MAHDLPSPGLLVWADLVSPTRDELELLASELDLDPNAVEDAVAPHERAKAAQHEGYIFFITYATLPGFASTEGDEEDQLSKIAGFSFPGGLVTIRASDRIDTSTLTQRINSNREFLRPHYCAGARRRHRGPGGRVVLTGFALHGVPAHRL